MSNEKQRVVLTLRARALAEQLREEDRTIPGDYLYTVDADLPEDSMASAVLDHFHGHIAVDELEDFAFTVWRGETLLSESDDHENGTLEAAVDFVRYRILEP